MLLLILMPMLMYFGLIGMDEHQGYSGIVSAPFLGFVLTVLFIVYLELVDRSVKVKFSIFLILAWVCLLSPGFFVHGQA
ncbi:hypothetical protein IQB76_15690 [Leptospira borgpetersenii serovar Hardjo-bovis]|nr:hypothetical protein LBK6_16010 [Leptospira borgpetersenii serovar Hardjo]AYR09904.1 hypothetical protein D1609_17295 [Leptospira borgpetersenii serovar Hardjo-bovis]TQE51001.1 hypothetical protein FFZ95_16185 [Leptospira borgpetersenii]AMX62994.1 hypothetical protein LBK9_15925 [Leptospira borgpetersenii serovar Hardjo]AMX66237.1 hypothetical protein LBK30_15925 [Leptospira borgpetersenii serovar Hardjo]